MLHSLLLSGRNVVTETKVFVGMALKNLQGSDSVTSGEQKNNFGNNKHLKTCTKNASFGRIPNSPFTRQSLQFCL